MTTYTFTLDVGAYTLAGQSLKAARSAASGTGAFVVNAYIGTGRLGLRFGHVFTHPPLDTERLLPVLEKVRVNSPILREATEQ